MKTIQEIISELQAVDATALDAVVAAVNQAVADLQALSAPAADPIATIVTTTQGGVTETFVPQA